MILTGEYRRTQRKSCPSTTLSTINPTWTALGVNLGVHDERPLTNHLDMMMSELMMHFDGDGLSGPQ
jgi:hypothetical protein